MTTGSIANCDRCSKVLLWPESYRAGRCSKCRDNPDEATVSETSMSLVDRTAKLLLDLGFSPVSTADKEFRSVLEVLRFVEREALERAMEICREVTKAHYPVGGVGFGFSLDTAEWLSEECLNRIRKLSLIGDTP